MQICHYAPPNGVSLPILSLHPSGCSRLPSLSLRALQSKAWQSRSTRPEHGKAFGESVSACHALSVTFGDSSPRGRAKVASLLGMTRQGGPAVGTVHCIEFAVLLPLRGRARLSAPLQWRVRSAILPGNLQLPMALATRKGHAASVRRQSRQRLRSERRYSQI